VRDVGGAVTREGGAAQRAGILPAMHGSEAPGAEDDENVVVTSGDVTSISAAPGAADPVAEGGSAIAVSLSGEGDVLNVAFVTGAGDVQIVQIPLTRLLPADGDERVVTAGLTALSGDVIAAGGGAATPVGSIAVAASLSEGGDLNLSFADCNGDMQLIETNVAQLLDPR
jgi:hypothetical protein